MSAVVEPLAVSYADAGDMLGVSERTVRRLVDAGDLLVTRIRGARRIDLESLRAYQAANTGTRCRIAGRALPSGGSATQRQAARELENLLAPPAGKKPRHLRVVGGSKPTE